MTITLSPEAEARLQAAAAQSGRTPDEIVAAFVETLPPVQHETNPTPMTRSVLDFEGMGKDNPIGMDAQEYVNEMRAEWDEREQSWRQSHRPLYPSATHWPV